MSLIRTVTSTIVKPNGVPWPAATVRFLLRGSTYYISPDESFPIKSIDVVSDSVGHISVGLVANLVEPYEVRMPDGEEFFIYVPYDSGAPITLETLRNIYSGVPFSQLPSLTGPAGPTGPSGGPAGRAGPGVVVMTRTFSTTTTDADPGSGVVRLNNATQNISTSVFIDIINTTATDQTALLDALDDSTSPIKGFVRIEKQSDSTAYLLGTLTAVTTVTGYRKLVWTVVNSSATNPFANTDALYVTFGRAGDVGSIGATGPAGGVGPTGPTGPAGSATPGGTTTQVQFNDAGVLGGDAGMTYAKATDALTVVGPVTVGRIILGAGTATAGTAPLKVTSGTNLTTPEAGASEYDGASWYDTQNSTSRRSIRNGWHEFRATTYGSNIGPAVADFFGANSALSLPASSMWRLEADLQFSKFTAGTVTWSVVNTAASYTSFDGSVEIDADGSTVFQALTRANIHNSIAATNTFPATPAISNGTYHLHKMTCTFQMNAAGNIRIRVESSAGTVVCEGQAFYRVRRMPGNTGNFVA